MSQPSSAHPFMANALPDIKQEMLDFLGVDHIEALFEQIPDAHRLKEMPELMGALRSEMSLSRHLRETLGRNRHCGNTLSFLGGGCWQHHVPAICSEIAGRSEFLTSVWGTPSSDQGRCQAWFEFSSQLGELVGCEYVGLPVYSWGCAAGHALRMASRLNQRNTVLLPQVIDPERLAVIRNYCEPDMANELTMEFVAADPVTGAMDLQDLERKLGSHVSAVYLETPDYFGLIDGGATRIGELAHAAGAEFVVGVDPLSLGILAPPPAYGADIVVGTIQTLGIPMYGGGGLGGFIATRDEERYAREYPTLLISATTTVRPGEIGFGLSLAEQSSYGLRENGKDWTGNSVYLWAIANAVYMSLMGPQGFVDVGELIFAQAHLAARRLSELPGVSVRHGDNFFKEFVVDFSASGLSVGAINQGLLARGIFGGHDLSQEFPGLGQCALYCVTELHQDDDIERLVKALHEVLTHD
ncbi:MULTISPECIES: aminomethyl-transferring glycine dehydrogenase subunit GcvPA [unclassified Pseudomonas]|uniref:aminomethyl-transferring glycine dehydrogenase subunit GcvPA n=1 Tax=unclassified Pseudomonas TaxID=196821 RepID=UPI000D3954E8|nr:MULTISPECIES: aminomethyl-transferring glycine dehydrogenase subunit GcvPA [unclassified Pseudomonas]RAU48017.1 aminomethyl-transferring glycine dehydrogenase subunit GcvPA [Pseudomonas sp. RIT 409]RAU55289.1 aminomethyl-transferring glycine dehydrogenase subunit GcvPA [Pseudomonas sp. RIT 412]